MSVEAIKAAALKEVQGKQVLRELAITRPEYYAKIMASHEQKIIHAFKSPHGRDVFAASMREPLRSYRDYVSVGRRALDKRALGNSLAYVDKDPDVKAYFIADNGESIEEQIKGTRIPLPLFTLASNPSISFKEIRERLYDIRDRVKKKATAEIFRKEDSKIFELLKTAAANNNNSSISISRSNATIGSISDAMGEVEKNGDIKASNVFLNGKSAAIIRKVIQGHFVDFETSKALMDFGFLATLYGSQVSVSSVVPVDTIYVTGNPELTGVIVVAQELVVVNADEPSKLRVGNVVFTEIGIVVHNIDAVAKVSLS